MKCGSWRCGEGRSGLEYMPVRRGTVFATPPFQGWARKMRAPGRVPGWGEEGIDPVSVSVHPPAARGAPVSVPAAPGCSWGAARGDLCWDWHCLCRDVYNTLYIFVYKRKKK